MATQPPRGSALHIDPKSSAPIWSQIEQQLQLLVARGALAPGDAVPSVRELAKELVVNPATVSKAYQRLTDLGLFEVRRGQGTFVAGDAGASLNNQLAEQETERVAAQLVAIARAAGLDLEQTAALVDDAWRSLDPDHESAQEVQAIEPRKAVGDGLAPAKRTSARPKKVTGSKGGTA